MTTVSSGTFGFPPERHEVTHLDTPQSLSGRSPADVALPIRVLLAEDEEPLRSAISDLVTSEPGLEMVGAVGDASEAIELAAATMPDVALVDVRMPGGGAEAAKGIREASPGTQVVALSAYEDRATVLELLDAGAVAYLVKGISPAEIVEAVHRAARGQASLSAEVVSAVLRGPAAKPEAETRTPKKPRHSGERFRGLIDAAPDAVVLADEAGTIVLVNNQTEELFGHDREALVGQAIETLLPGYLREAETRAMGAGLDLICHRRDGSEFPVEISLSAMEAEEGRLVIAFVRDITDRLRGESAALELAAIVASSSDAIVSESLHHRALTWNRGAEKLYGYSAEQMAGRSMSVLVPPGQLDELPGILERFKSGEQWIDQFETTRLRKDGSEIEVSIKISAIRDGSGTLVGLASIARDLTPLRAHRELERDLAERRALLAHLVSAGEEERARIAMDIHDDSIQAITAAGMRLQILRRRLDDPEQLKLLDELEQTIQLAISRLRHLLFELRPPVLDNEGLSAALGTYLEEVDDPNTDYHLDDQLTVQPPPESRTILYRIVQEALTNVRKHAQAGQATVALEEVENGFLARISDDGVGFVAGDEEPVPGHLGLAAMRERAELAGGWLTIKAAPGEGTILEVWIPVAPPSANGSEG
jgi:PAS domain S-box-containing protein